MVSVGRVKSADEECYLWLIDSGASSHTTKEKHILMNFQEFDEPEHFAVGDGCVVKVLGSGSLQMNVPFRATEPKKAVLCMYLNSLVTCFL